MFTHASLAATGAQARKKRILLTTFGSLGDLHPYLALAAGLRTRGHEPVIATSAAYRERITDLGLGFTPVRPDMPDPEVMDGLMQVLMDQRRGTEAVIRQVVLPALRETYADLLQAADGADLLVSHLLTFATPLVAEQCGIPWVSTALQPGVFFSVHDPAVVAAAPWLARMPFLGPWFWRLVMAAFTRAADTWFTPLYDLRAEIGLPPATGNPIFGNPSPWLTLALFSPRFAAPQPDWPPRTVATGFPFLQPPGGPLSPDLEAFLAAGPAPIVFTLGSAAVMVPGAFYRESARAAARLGQRAILLAGPEAASLSASLPDGVIAIDYAPHAALFPRASAIVHQGGIGTTAEAMRSGRPMLVMPFAHDQFDNASRVARLGIGCEISRKRYDAAYATRALRTLLDDPRYRQRASVVGEQIRAEDGVASACAALNTLLRGTPGSPPDL